MIEPSVSAESNEARVRWPEILSLSITTGGIFLFGLATVPISRFYDRFGLSPSDVGLNWLETLQQSSGLVVISIVIVGVTTMTAISRRSFYRLEVQRKFDAKWRAVDRDEEELKRQGGALREGDRVDFERRRTAAKSDLASGLRRIDRATTWVSATVLVVAFFALDLALIGVATSRSADLAGGATVQPVRLLTLTVLPVQGVPARVHWINPTASNIVIERGMWLGESGNITSVFDVSTKKTFRLPTTAAVVELTT